MTLSPRATDVAPLTLDEERTAADLLDSVAAPACEWIVLEPYADECNAPADWALVLSCGHTNYYCAEHRAAIDDYIAEPPVGVGCKQSPHRPKNVNYEWRSLS